MRIAVLIKQVPDTYGERKLTSDGLVDRDASDAIIDEISERALEVALQQKDADKSTEVVVVSMGPAEAKDALRKALSMGADSAIHVLDDALVASDTGWTAKTLAAAIQHVAGVDLVIAGDASTDGRGGVIPAMIAEHLGMSLLNGVDGLTIGSGVSGSQVTETGSRAVHAPLPAIVSITETADEARFPNFKGIMTAKRKPLDVVTLAELGVDPAFPGLARSVVLNASERPARAAGRKVVDEGNAADELVEFLAAQRLL